jgi:hypothetical protein
MGRKLQYNGPHTDEKSLVIGNHDHVQLTVKGSYFIDGLIYCPRYSLEITLMGEGSLSLHGICRRITVKKVTGKAIINFKDLKVKEFSCEWLGGNSVLKMQAPRFTIQKNIYDHASLYFDERKQNNGRSIPLINQEDTFIDTGTVLRFIERKTG